MDKILGVIKNNPWYVVAGLIIGLFLLRSGSSAPRAASGPDYSATLASQEISANTNVALAGVQADREAIAAGQNIAAIQAQRDIALGAQQVAISNKALRTQETIAGMDQMQTFAAVNSDLAQKTLTTLAGVKVARDDMALQKYTLDVNAGLTRDIQSSNERIQMADFGMQERVAGAGIGLQHAQIQSDERITGTSLANDLVKALQGMNYDFQFGNNQLFYDYRTTDRVMANLENLYWRQKQMNKSNNLFGFLNTNVQAIGSFAEKAVSSGMF